MTDGRTAALSEGVALIDAAIAELRRHIAAVLDADPALLALAHEQIDAELAEMRAEQAKLTYLLERVREAEQQPWRDARAPA